MTLSRNQKRHSLFLPLIAGVMVLLLVSIGFDPNLKTLWWGAEPARAVGGHVATDLLGVMNESFTSEFIDVQTNQANISTVYSQFRNPNIVLDATGGYLYVTDVGDNRVLGFEVNGSNQLVDRLADVVLGQSNMFGHGTGLTSSSFNTPGGLALDETGRRLFVQDGNNDRVLVFDITTVVSGEGAINVLGQADFTSNGGGTTQSTLNFSTNAGAGMVYNNDLLFVADDGNSRVMVFNVASITDGENAANVLGQPNFTTSTSGTTQAKLAFPKDVDYGNCNEGSDCLFVADYSNRRVMIFEVSTISNGENAVRVLGQPDFTSNSGATTQVGMNLPEGVAAGDNTLYVADATNNRVLIYDVGSFSNGASASFVLGQTDFTTSTAGVTQSKLDDPSGMYYDSTNEYLYVTDADNIRVMIFDVASITDGENAVDGFGQLDENYDPFYTANGLRDRPNAYEINGRSRDVALDATNHRLFVSSRNENRIMVFNLDTDNSVVDTLAGRTADYVLGRSDFKGVGGSGATQDRLNSPRGIDIGTLSGTDYLFVADTSNHRVMIWDLASLATGASASYVLGQPDFVTSSSGTTDSKMSSPNDVSFDATLEQLAVADNSNSRVLIFDLSGGISSGMAASLVVGQPDFTTSTTGTTATTLSFPEGVVLESTTNHLWVADTSNNRVLAWEVGFGTGASASNVLGQSDFTSSGSGLSSSSFDGPGEVQMNRVAGGEAHLLVSDQFNNRLLDFNVDAISDGEDAVDVFGQDDMESNTPGATSSQFGENFLNIAGTAFDCTNDQLFVADAGNNRVLLFPLSSTSLCTSSGGTPTPTSTSGGGPPATPYSSGFFPERIEVNDDEGVTDSKNVFVTIFARNSSNFKGTIDVLLSNDPAFSTFIPFRYNVPEEGPSGPIQDIWPKTVAWDLCWGLPNTIACDPGQKTVYARFYVNIPAPSPVFTPLITQSPFPSPIATLSTSVGEGEVEE